MDPVLVPLEILQGQSLPPGLIDLLGTVDVTLLGYEELPEQTPTDQARHQFEERALAGLEDVAEELRAAGSETDVRLVFTHDRVRTIERVHDEIGAGARVISGPTGDIERLLVPLSGEIGVDRLVDFVEHLIGERPIGVTLLAATEAVSDDRLSQAGEQLREAGIEVTELTSDAPPFDALVDAVPGHDAVVTVAEAPSFSSLIFGDEAEQVARASVGPVIVVSPAGPGSG